MFRENVLISQVQIHLLDTNVPPKIYPTPENEYVRFTVNAPLVSKLDILLYIVMMMTETVFLRNFTTKMMLAMFTVSGDLLTPALQHIICKMVTPNFKYILNDNAMLSRTSQAGVQLRDLRRV